MSEPAKIGNRSASAAVFVDEYCSHLDKLEGEEVEAFMQYAQEIGLLNRFNSREKVYSLCNRYRWRKRKLSEEDKKASATGGLRSASSYSHTLAEVLELVTLQTGTMPVGSFKYNIHKYNSDIDLMEQVHVCCSVDEAAATVTRELQRMMKRIKVSPNVYLGDFKAGKDDRFDIDLGKWETALPPLPAEDKGLLTNVLEYVGLSTPVPSPPQEKPVAVLVGYNPRKIERDLRLLAREKLISQQDLAEIVALLQGAQPTREQWDKLSGLLRNYTVLRWTSNEILQGYKTLPGNVIFTLEDAVKQKTMVKLDVWARINGRFIEVTNIFLIAAVEPDGRVIESLTQDLPDYVKSVGNDVRTYSDPAHRKTLKALKRLWILSLFKNDLELAEMINPIFATSASGLNQIVGEAEVMGMMLEKLPHPPVEQIMEQIDGFKTRIDQMNAYTPVNEELYALIDSVVVPFYNMNPGKFNMLDETVVALDKIQERVSYAVEQMVRQAAEAVGLETPASFL